MLFLKRLFAAPPKREEAGKLYAAMAEQARHPDFYTSLGVPDSIDGRFELLCVHAHAVFHRLRGQGHSAEELSQAVYDVMFADLDGSLREIGAADIGVGRRIKFMTEALKGRIHAYDAALADESGAGAEALRAAIARNVYGTVTPSPHQVAAIAGYLRTLRDASNKWALSDLMAGRIAFPLPPIAEVAQENRHGSG